MAIGSGSSDGKYSKFVTKVHKEREWKVKGRVKQQIKKGNYCHKRMHLNSLIALIL